MIVGLDLATRLCGYCYGNGSSVPIADAWAFPDVGADLGALAMDFGGRLEKLIARERPHLIVYEAPILVSSRDKLLVVRKLYGLGWEVERIAKAHGIECMEAGLRRIKKELAGHSGADKSDMVAAALRAGVVLPATKIAGKEDAADAFGAWLMGLRYADKRLSAIWDGRLYSSRGSLL